MAAFAEVQADLWVRRVQTGGWEDGGIFVRWNQTIVVLCCRPDVVMVIYRHNSLKIVSLPYTPLPSLFSRLQQRNFSLTSSSQLHIDHFFPFEVPRFLIIDTHSLQVINASDLPCFQGLAASGSHLANSLVSILF